MRTVVCGRCVSGMLRWSFEASNEKDAALLRMCVGLTPPKDWFSDQTIYL